MSVSIVLVAVLSGVAGLLVSANDAPFVVSLLVISIWLAGFIARIVTGSAGHDAWRAAWIVGCVIGIAAATTSMAGSTGALVAGAFITLATAAAGIWTINNRIPPSATSR